jgi:putative aldouronate transport system substrate-binding protein
MKNPLPRAILLTLALALLSPLTSCGNNPSSDADDRITIRLAAPQNSLIEDFDSNLYKLWLEEQTGLKIEMIWLPEKDAEQIAKLALNTGEDLPDAYIGFGSHNIFKQPNLQTYIDSGVIIPLTDYISQFGTHTQQIYEHLKDFYVKELMTQSDGNVYFMPGFTYHAITRYSQILWINQGWLDALNMGMPSNTDELYDVLVAFRDKDPNKNGIKDEIPMAGTEEAYSKQPYDNLMNAFIYNDPKNSRLYIDAGQVEFGPVTDAWRDGLIYLHKLHDEGLYSPLSFTQGDQQIIQIANDPDDILGAFTVSGFTYTVMQSNHDVISRYTPVAPLEGPDGVRLCTLSFPLPKPNGVITSVCEYPEEVFKLFDLMLSEEASLMRLGTQGEDWDFATEDDVSIFNTPATIRIYNQLWKAKQNKHLMEIEPYVRWLTTTDVTADSTGELDGEYINAQARLLYIPHEPEDRVLTLVFDQNEMVELNNIRGAIDSYTNTGIVDFITGKSDIHDDAVWEAYKAGFYELGLERFLAAAQKSYEQFK